MSFFEVPLRNDLPNYSFRVTLSGVIYTLYLHYNVRMDRWIMDIQDASGNQILSGIALIINRNLTGQYRTLQIPTGVFFCTDETNKDTQPTLDSFGTNHSMWYSDPTQ
jgi:hypothetical protein